MNVSRARPPASGPSPRPRAAWTRLPLIVPALLLSLRAAGPAVDLTPASSSTLELSDLSLKELLSIEFDSVSTASRRTQRIADAPAAVSLVTRDEIRSFGYRTLADVVSGSPGAYTTDDRYYTYVGFRGFSRPGDYNSRVLLLVDGSRANDNLYDSGWVAQESPVDVDNIERVEIIRGPTSSLYGSSAFFGTINVITRRGGSLNGVEMMGETASYRTYRSRVAAGYKLRSGLEFFAAASVYDSHGQDPLYYPEFDDPSTHHGRAEGLDYERARHYALNASYRHFTLSGAYNTRLRGIPTGSFGGAFNDPRARTEDISGYLDLKFEYELANGLQLMARVGEHRYDYHGWYPYAGMDPADPARNVLNLDAARGAWRGIETMASRRFADRVTVTAGFEVRDNFHQDQTNVYDFAPTAFLIDSHARDTVFGTYSQVDWNVAPRAIVSAGLRYDHYESFGGSFSPRLGLIVRPWTDGALKLLHGRAFRAPNAYESHYVFEGSRANPDLQPETIRTYEAILEHSLDRNLKLTAAASYYRVRGLITYDYDPAVDSFQNLDSARTISADFGFEGRWDGGWFTRLSYTTQQAEDGKGVELTNSPRHLGKAHLRVPLFSDRAALALEVHRTGRARAVQGGTVDPSWLTHLTLTGQPFGPALEISASAYNLFDRAVGQTGFEEHRQRILYRPGRQLRLRLTYRY